MLSAEDEVLLVVNDIQPVKQFIQQALALKLKGNSSHYNHVCTQIINHEDQELTFRILIALASNASTLTHSSDSFRDLIQGLYAYDWSAEAKLSVAMINMLGSLVSSNATFLIPTFQYLVKSMVPTQVPTSSNGLSSGQEENRRQNMARIHRCIRSLLSAVPTGQCELFPILASTFPHKRFDLHILESYVTELFRICEYFPGIEESILNLIISRCLEIDVEIVIEETGEAKIKDDVFESFEANEHMFLLDDQENAKLSGFRQFSGGAHKISNEVASMADKLDVLLICLLQYLFEQLSKNKKEITQYMFNALLNIFEEKILATHRSKFVQFILFFVAGFTSNSDHNFHESFGQRLLNIFLKPTFAPIKRQSAVLYLASFISRANFLPLKFVVHIYLGLLEWASTYATNYESYRATSVYQNFSMPSDYLSDMYLADSRDADELHASLVQRHETFYYCVQALCYITCFYGSELLIHLRQQSPSLNKDWEKVALAELKPLKYCLYTIRYEFLRFAQSVELMSDFALSILSRDLGTIIVPRDAIETTDTEIKPSVSMKAPVIEASVQAPLETFFPFDPCYLISLHQYIDKYYRPWRGLPGLNGDGSSIDAMSHADEEESSCVMSTADGKQHNHSTSVSSSNMSSVASNAYYGMSGLSNVTFSMHGSSHINENASTGMSKSGNLASEGDDHASLGTFKRENVDFGTREEGLLKTAPMRRPRQYSISSTGSW